MQFSFPSRLSMPPLLAVSVEVRAREHSHHSIATMPDQGSLMPQPAGFLKLWRHPAIFWLPLWLARKSTSRCLSSMHLGRANCWCRSRFKTRPPIQLQFAPVPEQVMPHRALLSHYLQLFSAQLKPMSRLSSLQRRQLDKLILSH